MLLVNFFTDTRLEDLYHGMEAHVQRIIFPLEINGTWFFPFWYKHLFFREQQAYDLIEVEPTFHTSATVTVPYSSSSELWGENDFESSQIVLYLDSIRNFLKVLGFVFKFKYNFIIFTQIRIWPVLLYSSLIWLVFLVELFTNIET